ncbi:hypothetical protein NL108_008138 [Boleophthalmus pectinirostris]|nr:hypothetical protein NL108_008138 [Boleophthalmus pectinirostris]
MEGSASQTLLMHLKTKSGTQRREKNRGCVGERGGGSERKTTQKQERYSVGRGGGLLNRHAMVSPRHLYQQTNKQTRPFLPSTTSNSRGKRKNLSIVRVVIE